MSERRTSDSFFAASSSALVARKIAALIASIDMGGSTEVPMKVKCKGRMALKTNSTDSLKESSKGRSRAASAVRVVAGGISSASDLPPKRSVG